MAHKFERLEVRTLAVAYTGAICTLAEDSPPREKCGLWSQITRARSSVALNTAEGPTGRSGAGQARFVGLAVRSRVETVACLHLIRRRGYLPAPQPLRDAHKESGKLFAKLGALRSRLRGATVREEAEPYNSDLPF
jgi:four helix bundle protein